MAASHVCRTLEFNTLVPDSFMSDGDKHSSSGPCMQAYMKYCPDVGWTLHLARDRGQFRIVRANRAGFCISFFFQAL